MALARSLINHHRHLNVGPKFLASVFNGKISRTQCFHDENRINPKVEARLKKRDGVGEEYKILYRAPYEDYCRIAYTTCCVTSTVLPPVFSTLIFSHGIGEYPVFFGGIELFGSGMDVGIFAAGLIIYITQVSIVVFKYPFRIYQKRSDDTYLLIYQHLLPWKYSKETFKAGELERCDAIFTWNNSLYKFRNRKAIIFDYLFPTQSHFEAMFNKDDKLKSS